MSQRHKGREYALQMLFQWEIGRQDPKRIEDGFWRMVRAAKDVRALANHLFENTVEQSAELDALVAEHAENWRTERMAVIDRAILKLAARELRAGKTPPKVVINEAVELTKTFSSHEAASFVNGVLDATWKSMSKESPGSSEATRNSSHRQE
jgi:N utilization substance protein B